MTTYTVLIIVCSIIIYSYLADILAKKTKIPAALVLLLSGIALRYLVDYLQLKTLNFNLLLPTLGTIGLIMIVFEGALELNYEHSKKRLIAKAFLAAFIVLVVSALLIAGVFFYFSGISFKVCLLNAIPFGVISSAIAIPSVAGLMPEKKEFIIYESSFSDILGIVFFNFMSTNEQIDFSSFAHLALETIEIVFIAFLSCLFLLYLLGRLTHHVKFVLIIAILILVYGICRQWHLPALVIVFAFGLFLKNVDLIKNSFFNQFFLYKRYNTDMHQLHQISAESAFLLRTFFFIIFGFTINLAELATAEVVQTGLIIFVITYLVRYVILRLTLKASPSPEFYITPRGLISILLFYSIADSLKIFSYESALLLFTVLATNLVMTFGLVKTK